MQLHSSWLDAPQLHSALHRQAVEHVQVFAAATGVSLEFVDIEHLVLGLTRCYGRLDMAS